MFRGSMVAIVTPMNADLSVDFDALADLFEFHIEKGTEAIVVVGTTGESATLSHKEHAEVIDFAVKQINKRVITIAGTGSNSTQEAIELTRHAKEVGVDGVLLVSPYYNKPTQEGLYQHHKAINDAVAIPQILYNVPGRTAVDILPETIGRLAQLENIVAVKEATGDLNRIPAIKEQVPEDFVLLTGDDGTAVDFILQGGEGGISVTANIAPDQVRATYDAARAGDGEKAHQLDQPLRDLHKTLFCEANPIPVKWALQRMGKIQPYLRLPLTPLSDTCQAPLEAAMHKAGLI